MAPATGHQLLTFAGIQLLQKPRGDTISFYLELHWKLLIIQENNFPNGNTTVGSHSLIEKAMDMSPFLYQTSAEFTPCYFPIISSEVALPVFIYPEKHDFVADGFHFVSCLCIRELY